MMDSFQITFTYEEVLRWEIYAKRLEWALETTAWNKWLALDTKAALPWCDTWWGEVEVTPAGYMVTIFGPEEVVD